jgi:hypothetical protein
MSALVYYKSTDIMIRRWLSKIAADLQQDAGSSGQ